MSASSFAAFFILILWSFVSQEAGAQVRLRETGAPLTKFVSLQAPASIATDFTLLLPGADGSINQCLAHNGSGGLTWRTVSATGYSLDAVDGSPTNAVYVDASGNVGVGITAPNALFDAAGSIAQSGDITPPQITVNVNNYAPTGLAGASILRLNSNASRTITGLTGGTDGRVIEIVNTGTFPIVLANENASSTTTNRFALTANLTLAGGQGVRLIYDGTSGRWRVTGTSGLGSGTSTWGLSGSDIYYTTGNVSIGSAQIASNVTITHTPNSGGIVVLGGPDPAAAVAAPHILSPVASGFSPLPVYRFWYQNTGLSNPATDAMGVVTNGTEVMRFAATNRVGIGLSVPTEKLHVLGNVRVQGSTDCTLGNGAGGTNCTSDSRLKNNVRPIENALDKILSLKGVEFDWNEKSQSPGAHAIGVIAQDVEKQFPTAVIESETGYKMVDYAVLVAPLIQAFKEFQNKISALTGDSEKQARELASLRSMDEARESEIARRDKKIKDLEQEVAKAKARLKKIEKTLSDK